MPCVGFLSFQNIIVTVELVKLGLFWFCITKICVVFIFMSAEVISSELITV